jgi:predicted RNA-binding Zn ribbon-like protein
MGTSTTRFRQGAGRLCLDFIRTLRYRGTATASEELADSHALCAWVRQFGPLQTAPDIPPPSAAAEARELRESIYELIQAARGARAADSCGNGARARINRAAAHPVPTPSIEASGRIRWDADDPVRATLALVARDAIDLAASPAVARVRECAGPRCGALFLDSSRPGTRRWCSMETCGNRAKKSNMLSRSRRPAH